jgi:Uncharacterised nucleotidyltransferase
VTAPAAIWAAVDRLIDAAASPRDLRAHGLHLLAVRRWRAQRRPIPPELVAAERAASFVALAAPAVLAEARAAYDGPIVLLKGPELAARYPDPALRPYGDLDLLVADAEAAHGALVAAGFVPAGPPPPEGFHHVQPLQSSRFPLRVELHTRPNWVEGAEPPPVDELLRFARPTAVAADGILAPGSAHHALLVAAHAWKHEPLGRISHLVDIALVDSECDRSDIDALAARWGVTRLWRATIAVVDSVLFGRGKLPGALPLPARKLERVEERTVLESHVYRALAPFWVLPPGDAVRTSARALVRTLGPAPGETWPRKARRAVVTLRHMFMRRSDHERAIGFRP